VQPIRTSTNKLIKNYTNNIGLEQIPVCIMLAGYKKQECTDELTRTYQEMR